MVGPPAKAAIRFCTLHCSLTRKDPTDWNVAVLLASRPPATSSSRNIVTAEHPPELKGYHARTMLHAFVVALFPLGAWAWAYYRQETYSADDDLQSALHWVFMAGVGLLMVTFLFKALVSLPKCPKCHRKMQQRETIAISEKTFFNLRSKSQWRVVECPHCVLRYRIPGLSHGDA
jgi:hypothetical protein